MASKFRFNQLKALTEGELKSPVMRWDRVSHPRKWPDEFRTAVSHFEDGLLLDRVAVKSKSVEHEAVSPGACHSSAEPRVQW